MKYILQVNVSGTRSYVIEAKDEYLALDRFQSIGADMIFDEDIIEDGDSIVVLSADGNRTVLIDLESDQTLSPSCTGKV
jgi:hypothetical protein